MSANLDYWTNFGTNLRRLRLGRGLTQEQLGKIVGVTGSFVAYWERHERRPKANEVFRLADYFNKPLDEFFGRSPLGGRAKGRGSFDVASFRQAVEGLVRAGRDVTAYLKRLERAPRATGKPSPTPKKKRRAKKTKRSH
ncbi:MAG: helix-turn-helix transcriptional regulator [Phycisphaerales bacterium]|nr:MAG: helix-turn-helix transcriptional regulator [Phycisphaerales bacterium]